MLTCRSFHLDTFLPAPYQDALAPRLTQAAQWLRDGSGTGGEFTGWVHLPRDYDKEEFARILSAAAKIQRDSKALVVIGIGGSYLGARGVIECLCSPNYNLKKKSTPNIYFVGNGLSADALNEVVELLADEDFSVNVISKSGTTTEPAVAFRFFRKAPGGQVRRRRGGEADLCHHRQGPGRPQVPGGQSKGWETFVVPDDVGGRYSVLTAVGLLPIAVAGVDITALMAGAAQDDGRFCLRDGWDYPAWQLCRRPLQPSMRRARTIEMLGSYEPCLPVHDRVVEAALRRERGQGGQGSLPRQRGVHRGPPLHGPVHPAGRAADAGDHGPVPHLPVLHGGAL